MVVGLQVAVVPVGLAGHFHPADAALAAQGVEVAVDGGHADVGDLRPGSGVDFLGSQMEG